MPFGYFFIFPVFSFPQYTTVPLLFFFSLSALEIFLKFVPTEVSLLDIALIVVESLTLDIFFLFLFLSTRVNHELFPTYYFVLYSYL